MPQAAANPRRRLSAVGLLLWGCLVAIPAGAADVETDRGWVRGTTEAGVTRFLGLRYAAPPTGDNRWRAPRPVPGWSGVRDASEFGPACLQFGNFYVANDAAAFDRPFGVEDCLFLNIWRPADQAAARPVLVFIHGGSGKYGSAAYPLYDATRLARELNAVVVSFNYRLGFFGNLRLPSLQTGDAADASGSYGLLDQIAALTWVQTNIAAFGGNPDNVTVMGHSAGCVTAWALMRAPRAAGRFHRVICLSGLPFVGEPEAHRKRARRFVDNWLGQTTSPDAPVDNWEDWTRLPPERRAALLRQAPADVILQAGKGMSNVPFAVDGNVQLDTPEHAPAYPVPALIGNTRDEATLFAFQRFGGPDRGELWKLINNQRDQVTRGDFFDGWFDRSAYAVACWIGNYVLKGRVDDAADQLAALDVPVYRYEFHWNHMPQPWRGVFGVYHGLDLPFIFGNFERDHPAFTRFSWGLADISELEAIHEQFIRALSGYIRTGQPGGDPPWPEWNTTHNTRTIP